MNGRTETASEPDPLRLRADDDAAGARLDAYLARRLPQYSRSRLQEWIRAGRVHVDGTVERSNHRLSGGETLEVRPAAPQPATLEPADIPLDILHRDDDLLVLNKAAGMVVHPGSGTRATTLVHALLGLGETLSGVGGPERPGIVHRLDKGTSGLLVAAKTDLAHRGLAEQFRAHSVDREYLALVRGSPRASGGSIDSAIGRHPTDRKRFSTRVRSGRAAVTHWQVERRLSGFALLRVRLETGRTHQIRVHLASAGLPVVGDPVYGGGRAVARELGLGRQALHAALLGFEHPVSGERLRFRSPLPADLGGVLAGLEK